MTASYWDALKARRAQASPTPAVQSSMPTPAHQSTECPCGRARAGCEYHDPALQPGAQPPRVHFRIDTHPDGTFDVVVLDAVHSVSVKGKVSI